MLTRKKVECASPPDKDIDLKKLQYLRQTGQFLVSPHVSGFVPGWERCDIKKVYYIWKFIEILLNKAVNALKQQEDCCSSKENLNLHFIHSVLLAFYRS